MDGVENWFVLTNIFGKNFSFVQSQIDLVSSDLLSGRMDIDFIVDYPVKYPPAKWENWDKVYIRIYFGFVEELHSRIADRAKDFIIRSISVKKTDHAFMLKIESENGDRITSVFGMARVQNVKPLVYQEKYHRYCVDKP